MRIIFFSLGLLFCLINSVFALNFGDIKGLARVLARDISPATGDPRVSEVVISSFTNAAQDEIAGYTWCLDDKQAITIVAGQREYTLSSDVISIRRLTIDDDRINPVSVTKLDDKDGSWEANLSTSSPATPSYYFVNYTTYNALVFDNYPSTTTDTTIDITYVKKPTQLIASTDVPFDGQPRLYTFHFSMVLYVAAFICYADGRPVEGDRYYSMYIDRIKNMEKAIHIDADYIPSMSGSR